jgi:hypothetical protein
MFCILFQILHSEYLLAQEHGSWHCSHVQLITLFSSPESQNVKALDLKSHETRAHPGNDLHKIFAKNDIRFQGDFA